MLKKSKMKTALIIGGTALAAGLAYRFIPGFATLVNNSASKMGELAGKAGDVIKGGAEAAGGAVASAGEAVADMTVSS